MIKLVKKSIRMEVKDRGWYAWINLKDIQQSV